MQAKATKLVFIWVVIALQPVPGRGQAEPVRLTQRGNAIQVLIGGLTFTTYHFDPGTAKAYLEPLRNAHDVIVTRAFPVDNTIPAGHEHDRSLEPHQRSMYFAHGDIAGYNFWSEEVFEKYYGHHDADNTRWGRMVVRKINEMHGGSNSGVIRATFDLMGDQKPVGEETQQFIFRGDSHSRVIDCAFVIRANHGALRIGDTKEGTFAIRVAPELDAPTGHMVNSEGAEGEGQIRGKHSNWVNDDGVIGGQPLGIAIFDGPESFRHPTTWFVRGYGLVAANPFYFNELPSCPPEDGSYTIPPSQAVRFCYRVLIHDGNYEEARVAERYKEYATHP